MTLDECRLLIPQYLSGHLNDTDKQALEAMLPSSPDLRLELAELQSVWEGLGAIKDEEPSPALRARFYQQLNALSRGKRPSLASRILGWKLAFPQLAAGLALFALGLFTGRHAPDSEAVQMRSQVQTLRETVALSLLDRQSATSRLEGVSWSNRVDKPDEELRSALVRTLNHDPNVNVRLASLDALEKFSNDAGVRKELVDSISLQDSPLVQIALIDAVVHMHDHDAALQLKKVTADSQLNEAVRQRAQWGLKNLGL
jgi:hypothetical protein